MRYHPSYKQIIDANVVMRRSSILPMLARLPEHASSVSIQAALRDVEDEMFSYRLQGGSSPLGQALDRLEALMEASL